MDSKSIITFLPLAALATGCTQNRKADNTDTSRPNIVYIMTDDHTAQMLSAYDTRYVSTPNLDRIARDGIKFTQSYVANSLSGPSRACMMTGKHSHNNGFTNNEHGIFDGTQQTMPKLLQKAGYETALIGKWHLITLPTGFNHWEIVTGQGDYYNPDFITKKEGTEPRGVPGEPYDTHREKGYLTDIITDKALDWVENQHDKSKPFALFIHHKACHRCWLPPMKYLNEYEDKTFPIPDTFYDDYNGRKAAGEAEMNIDKHMTLDYDCKILLPETTSSLRENYLDMINRLDSADRVEYMQAYEPIINDFKKKKLSGRALAEYKFQRYMRDYAKVLKSLDDNVGRVLDYLQEKGLLDNTLVVYTSDQGFYMGEHGWFDKRFMYRESFSTPLIMRLPKQFDTRGEIHEMVQNIDYAPTFLELAGAPVPDDMDGVSLLPLLQGKHPSDWRKSLYYHYYEFPAEHNVRRHYGVMTERYKLIHFYPEPDAKAPIDAWELYDLAEDPAEMHNIYGTKGTEKITEELLGELKKLQTQYHDPILEQQ